MYAQSVSFEISGSVVSSIDKIPLESATVYLQKVKDSSIIAYTITDAQGVFKLNDITSEKQLNFFVSFVGYQVYNQKIEINQDKINLKKIALIPSNTLNEVVVKSSAPITIKKDTLEFNVSSFKTRTNATIEDLLKKLPGVEVTSNGQIKVNGREVNKILVNGKPFFSNDPTIATRSLSKDFIDLVQVTKTKSKEQAFAGEKGSATKRTINFVIKKDKGKGTFGRLAGGLGTDERNELAGIVNYFNDDRRLSVLGGGNNINSPGFSFGEIQKMFGRGENSSKGKNGSFEIDGRQFGGEDGIIISSNVGLNYTDDIGKTVEYSGNYFYSDVNSIFMKTSKRESLIPDLRYITNTSSNSDSNIENHNANFDFEIVVDSTFLITVKPSFRNSKGTTQFDQTQESRTTEGELINNAETKSYVKTKANNFNNQLGITKRIGEKGSFLKFKLNSEFNLNETDNFLLTTRNTFGNNPNSEFRNLFSNEDNNTNNIEASSTFRLPLRGYSLFLDFNYKLNSQKRQLLKNTFEFNEATQKYDLLNSDFSASIDYLDLRNTPGFSLGYVKDKWSLTFGFNYTLISLKNKDSFRSETNQTQNFKALESEIFYAYNFKPGTLLNVTYSSRKKTPDFNTLQSYQHIDDPLKTVIGNPDLQLSREHQVFAIFNALNFEKGSGFRAIVSAFFIDNQIVSSTVTNSDLTSETTYENVDGFYQINTDLGYNKKKKISEKEVFKYDLGLKASVSNFVNFNNGLLTNTTATNLSPTIRLTYILNDILEIEPTYSIGFNKVEFDLASTNNQNFARHNIGINTIFSTPKNFEWRNDINYYYNPNVGNDFHKNTLLWNTTLDYLFLENKATASLKIYDLLNQNTDAARRSGSNFMEDEQSTVLQRYFMLSINWRFDTFRKD